MPSPCLPAQSGRSGLLLDGSCCCSEESGCCSEEPGCCPGGSGCCGFVALLGGTLGPVWLFGGARSCSTVVPVLLIGVVRFAVLKGPLFAALGSREVRRGNLPGLLLGGPVVCSEESGSSSGEPGSCHSNGPAPALGSTHPHHCLSARLRRASMADPLATAVTAHA